MYSPAGTVVRLKVERIFEEVRLVMVPKRTVLPLTSETVDPLLNAVPVMVTGMVVELNPVAGIIVVIVGVAFVTMKASDSEALRPSGFKTLRVYMQVGAPVRVNEDLIAVLLTKVTEPGILILEFVRFTIAPAWK